MVYGGSLYVFGGFDKFHHVLGDLWEFKIEERRWEQVNTTSPLGSESRQDPTARAEHTAVMYKNQMIIFGGYDGKKKLNDTYVCNLLTREWMKIPSPVVNAPSRRCKHAAVIYDKRMYILGGFQFINGENFAQTDLHVLDCEEFSWSPIALQGDYPGALQVRTNFSSFHPMACASISLLFLTSPGISLIRENRSPKTLPFLDLHAIPSILILTLFCLCARAE